jgi:WD40 repeat protein
VATWAADGILSPVLSPDGDRIAAIDRTRRLEPKLKIWHVDDPEKPVTIELYDKDKPRSGLGPLVPMPSFTADGKQVVLLGSTWDTTSDNFERQVQVTRIDSATGKELTKQRFSLPQTPGQRAFGGFGVSQASMALSPDGSRLILVRNGAVVYDTVTGKQVAIFQPNQGQRHNVVFSPDGERVALWPIHVASAGQIWKVQPPRLLKTLKGHTTGVVQLAFSPDGTRLYSADNRGTLKEWDATPPAAESFTLPPLEKRSTDGSRLLVRPAVKPEETGSSIYIHDAAGTVVLTFLAHKATVVSAAISANGRYALSEDEAGATMVWETATGEILLKREVEKGFSRRYQWAMFSANGRRLAAADPSGGVKVWDLDKYRELFATSDHAIEVQLSPDGERLALTLPRKTQKPGSREFAIKVLSATGAVLGTFDVDDADMSGVPMDSLFQLLRGGPGPVVFSPDKNRVAATSGTADVLVWDIPSGKKIHHLRGHVSNVSTVAFSPDGTRLASMTGNRFQFTRGGLGTGGKGSKGKSGGGFPRLVGPHEVILWDLATGNELMR